MASGSQLVQGRPALAQGQPRVVQVDVTEQGQHVSSRAGCMHWRTRRVFDGAGSKAVAADGEVRFNEVGRASPPPSAVKQKRRGARGEPSEGGCPSSGGWSVDNRSWPKTTRPEMAGLSVPSTGSSEGREAEGGELFSAAKGNSGEPSELSEPDAVEDAMSRPVKTKTRQSKPTAEPLHQGQIRRL